MNLRLLCIIGCLFTSPMTSWSQEDDPPLIPQEDFDDLLMWMVDGKFEKVLYKAIRYTENDKTSKEPLPYVFMSMAFFKISETSDAELLEDYPGALKNALKYASKFVKKDREKNHYSAYTAYFNDLRRATMNEAEMFVDNEKFTKAKSYYKYLYTLDREDPGAWLMYGTVLWKNNSKRDAQESWAKAMEILTSYGGKGLEEVQVDLLKYGVIYTAEMLSDLGDRSGAFNWLDITNDLFSDDREMQAVRRSMGG